MSSNFNSYSEDATAPKRGGCFAFNLNNGKFEVNQDLINDLPNDLSPKNNQLSFIIVIENGEVTSGRYSNGTTGIQYISLVSIFDCAKRKVTHREQILGSEPPSSATVRSGGHPKGSKVTSKKIIDFINNHVK